MIDLILKQTLIITTFVLGMMMVIEYINIQTRGLWSNKLQKSPISQIIMGSLMGIIPGCLGTYTMVSLYVHRVVMFPALVATLIATSGDEAFFMFSTIPVTALKLTGILFVIGVATGILIHFTVKNKFVGLSHKSSLPLHQHEACNTYHPRLIIENLRNITFTRALLIAGVLGILISLATGIIDGSHHLNTLMAGSENAAFLHDTHDHAHDHDHGGEADWIR
ncbi:MAG: hypothetical protein K8F24_10665, partial [Bacteroidales bacterium]|nr:hypothetical protein [Bacteroidales bacterium]